MMPALTRLKLEKRGGFTLAEAVLALGVLSLVVVLCLSAISFSRVTSYKAKEEAVAMGFL
jgi:type II secretory pathway component PulJ